MYNPQTHYRAQFSVERTITSRTDHVFRGLLSYLGSWLKTHTAVTENTEQIFKGWFYQGGRLQVGNSAWVEVKTDNFDPICRCPEFWVMRFEHPDSQFRQRKWRMDIALRIQDENSADFSVTVTRYLRDNYLGEEPEIPESSVPNFVKNILNSTTLQCRADKLRLQPTASHLSLENCYPLHYYITSEERTLPVILINIKNRGHVISVDDLQSLVIGSGLVFFYDDAGVHQAMAKEWGDDAELYQCGPDSIRIYLPGLSTPRWSNPRWHKYFNLAKYEESGDRLTHIITQSIFRITYHNLRDFQVADLESLYLYQQKKRLATLRAATANTSRSEDERLYLEALEEENTQVNTSNRTLQADLQAEKDKSQYLDLQLHEVREQLRQSQQQFQEFAVTDGQYKKTIADQDDKRQYYGALPTSLADDLRLIGKLFPEKIHVLDAAYTSAEEAEFEAIPDAHELLYQMANRLHELYFLVGSTDIVGDCKAEGLDVTMSESSMTRDDKKLMALRKRFYDGEERDFSPHAKLHKGGKDLRVHFYADHARKLIVIGHCGDHLKTAGTTRRKE